MKTFGLTSEQAVKSREQFGSNSLTEQKQESFWHKLLANLSDPMIRILCAALLLNLIFVLLHELAQIGDTEWYETVGIAAAILIASVVSTVSEYKNENSFRKLQQEASRIRCKVCRDGAVTEIPIQDIVRGDAVLLQTGDKVPADGFLVDGHITVDQSALNGESREASKQAGRLPEGQEPDFLDEVSVFRGAVVCSGSGIMIAETVGDRSVYGKIAGELQQADDRPSPLKVKLTKLANMISRFGYLGGAAIAVGYLIQCFFFGSGGAAAYFSSPELWIHLLTDIVRAVMFAVIIIVMAVPEGLPLMIAIVSSMNMKKMLKDQVLVRKVVGIETAGSLNILFSDKTGTITKGQLEAVLFLDGQTKEARHCQDIGGPLRELLTLSLRHNTDAVLSGKDGKFQIVGGNPTERAVLRFAAEEPDPAPEAQVLHAIPFSSVNKYSAASVTNKDKTITFLKGAPEILLPRCRTCYDQEGKKIPLDQEALNRCIDRLAERAIRVLAVAAADTAMKDDVLPECEWTLIGVIGIRDEVRPESAEAIREVTRAGVQVVMITGDRKETAAAIAKDAGLLQSPDDLILTSRDLAEMTDEQIKEALPRIRVIARALPSDKSRLVRLSQEMNLVAGMTGDGVNDSPALKKADVGFAMGSGTEVAKEAGDIVILDDNFHSIAKAILYGRTIFNNIRKFISFQLTINFSAVLISFIMPLMGLSNPLSITQILWVNLVMDTLAALALGGEPALHRYLSEKPKRRDENIISPPMKSRLIVSTVWIFLLSLFLLLPPIWPESPVWFFVRNDTDSGAQTAHYPYLMTAYFTFFILAAVFNALNVRSETLNIFEHIRENKPFLVIMGLIVLIQIVMVYFGGAIFQCSGLNGTEWLLVTVLAFSVIPADLLRKALTRRHRQKNEKNS